MLQISINLTLNDKDKIKVLLDTITKCNLDTPVYIVEFEDFYEVSFESDYEQYELVKDFASNFKNYELVDNIESGKEDILLAIHRTQSAFSTDGWGRRWNEDDINSSTYLVKKRKKKESTPPQNKFSVLFGDTLKDYEVCIYERSYKNSDEKRYVVAKDFVEEGEKPEILSEALPSVTEAFWFGYRMLQPKIESDFEEYQKEIKKKKRSQLRKAQNKADKDR
jgi:hypothetical protein